MYLSKLKTDLLFFFSFSFQTCGHLLLQGEEETKAKDGKKKRKERGNYHTYWSLLALIYQTAICCVLTANWMKGSAYSQLFPAEAQNMAVRTKWKRYGEGQWAMSPHLEARPCASLPKGGGGGSLFKRVPIKNSCALRHSFQCCILGDLNQKVPLVTPFSVTCTCTLFPNHFRAICRHPFYRLDVANRQLRFLRSSGSDGKNPNCEWTPCLSFFKVMPKNERMAGTADEELFL